MPVGVTLMSSWQRGVVVAGQSRVPDVGSTTPHHRWAIALLVKDMDYNDSNIDNNGGGLWQHGQWDHVVAICRRQQQQWRRRRHPLRRQRWQRHRRVVALSLSLLSLLLVITVSAATIALAYVIAAAIVVTTATLHAIGRRGLRAEGSYQQYWAVGRAIIERQQKKRITVEHAA